MAKSFRKETDNRFKDGGKVNRNTIVQTETESMFCNCKNPVPSFDEDGEYCDRCGREM